MFVLASASRRPDKWPRCRQWQVGDMRSRPFFETKASVNTADEGPGLQNNSSFVTVLPWPREQEFPGPARELYRGDLRSALTREPLASNGSSRVLRPSRRWKQCLSWMRPAGWTSPRGHGAETAPCPVVQASVHTTNGDHGCGSNTDDMCLNVSFLFFDLFFFFFSFFFSFSFLFFQSFLFSSLFLLFLSFFSLCFLLFFFVFIFFYLSAFFNIHSEQMVPSRLREKLLQ